MTVSCFTLNYEVIQFGHKKNAFGKENEYGIHLKDHTESSTQKIATQQQQLVRIRDNTRERQ